MDTVWVSDECCFCFPSQGVWFRCHRGKENSEAVWLLLKVNAKRCVSVFSFRIIWLLPHGELSCWVLEGGNSRYYSRLEHLVVDCICSRTLERYPWPMRPSLKIPVIRNVKTMVSFNELSRWITDSPWNSRTNRWCWHRFTENDAELPQRERCKQHEPSWFQDSDWFKSRPAAFCASGGVHCTREGGLDQRHISMHRQHSHAFNAIAGRWHRILRGCARLTIKPFTFFQISSCCCLLLLFAWIIISKFANCLLSVGSIAAQHALRADPRLFKDDVDIRFSRTLNSCKLPQVRYATPERLLQRLTGLFEASQGLCCTTFLNH